MATNQRLKIGLSVGLAVLMPLLSNIVDGVNTSSSEFIQKWVLSSFYILSLWYGLLAVRHWKSDLRIGRSIAFIVVFLCFIVAIFYYHGDKSNQTLNWTLLIRLSFTGMVIYLIQRALHTQDKMTDLRIEKEQLQTENLKIQLKELRNQMDPHFFFNSLNTLRSMVRQNHQNSEQFIIGLSDFYRQLLKHQENTTLSLSEEIGVLKSYLFLMKNRNEKALHTDLAGINKGFDHHAIPTLALQSVVENCFKHNIMSSGLPLKIRISTTEDGYVEVVNNLQPRLSPQETSGRGLDLLKRRYQLLNIENGVILHSDEETFSVKLKLIPPQ